MTLLWLHYCIGQYKTRSTDYGLGIKHGLRYKSPTKHLQTRYKTRTKVQNTDFLPWVITVHRGNVIFARWMSSRMIIRVAFTKIKKPGIYLQSWSWLLIIPAFSVACIGVIFRPSFNMPSLDMLCKRQRGRLPQFSLICDFGEQNTRVNVSKISVSLTVIDRSDRNPPITATSVTFWPSC